MKNIIKKYHILIVFILLTLISHLYIVHHGNKYTISLDSSDVNNIEDVSINIENDIIKYTSKRIEEDKLLIDIEAIKEGKTFINVSNKGQNIIYNSFFVHKNLVITKGSYWGESTGSEIILVNELIFLIYLMYFMIRQYKDSMHESIYQYKNISYLGAIIFVFFAIINHTISAWNSNGIIGFVENILNLYNFSLYMLPLIFVVSILVTISNFYLVKREGFTWHNLLGLILGIVFIIITVLPSAIGEFAQRTSLIDFHNQNGVALYVESFIESSIAIFISYLDCILLGIIFLGIKAVKFKPKYDKDYVIILGCQIRKDGTLTKLLKERVDKAISFAKSQKENANKDIIFVPSGGKGSDEIISEAEAMKKYLIEQGIEEKNIIIENKSTNTYENIKFSIDLIRGKNKEAKIIYSTTNYHVFRAGAIAYEQGIKLEGIAARTKSYFWINAFIREFIATIVSNKKNHILTMVLINIITVFMIFITYLSNTM